MTILTAEQVARHCRDAGFSGEALVTAVAIAKAESGFETDAVGDVGLMDAKWAASHGLFQVRCLHAERGTGAVRDELANPNPVHNTRSAFVISSEGRNFTPWSVFGSGVYRRHLGAVRAACASVDPTVSIVPGPEDQSVLREGDRGAAVADLQRRLTEAGFPCSVDGEFGPETAEAVRAFQASRQLVADGIVGPQTRSALDAAGGQDDLPVLGPGNSGAVVADLQRRLTEAGFPCSVDGEFGPETAEAVRAFQASRQLTVDGIVGPQTQLALALALNSAFAGTTQ